jgi:hypothetical protein
LKKILKVTLCCLGDGSDLKVKDESYIVTEDMGNEIYTKDVEITKSFEPIENKYQRDYENDQSEWEERWNDDYIAMKLAGENDDKGDAQNKAKDDKGIAENEGLSFRRYCRRFGFFRKDAELVSRRYKNFEKTFEFYSQRERIVGMSYKRTIFSQAFDNNGKVDKDYIRESFRTARPLLFDDAFYFTGYEENSVAFNLESNDNIDDFFASGVIGGERRGPLSVSSSIPKLWTDLSASVPCVESSTSTDRLVTWKDINRRIRVSASVDPLVTNKILRKNKGEDEDVLVFLDEIEHDLDADVTLSEDQKDVFMYYFMRYHCKLRRVIAALETSGVISGIILLAVWGFTPRVVSNVTMNIFSENYNEGEELLCALLIYLLIYVITLVIYIIVYLIVFCIDTRRMNEKNSRLK